MTDMVRVELGGDTREVPAGEWKAAADELHAKHGGVPRVTPIVDTTAPTEPAPEMVLRPAADLIVAPNAAVAPTPSFDITRREQRGGLRLAGAGALEVPAGKLDPNGKARSEADAEAAEAAGFAVAPTLFDRGLRVDNAGRSRAQWEAMPLVLDNCGNLMAQIKREDRRDDVALVRDAFVSPDGVLHAQHVDGGDPLHGYLLTENAFASLVTRMGIPGGGRYLRACWTELRSINVNAWIGKLSKAEEEAAKAARVAERASEYAPLDMRLRHRVLSRPRPNAGELREVFGIVGPAYADLDADKIAEAIARATPEGARGRVTYDGRRTRFEILFQSTVQPRHFVAGEFFRAGVIVDTDDTGGGAIGGSAVAWQNLCLNLLIVQTTKTAHFSIRHVGDVDKLAQRFREGFARAMGAIDHFVKAWDFAVEDNVIESVRRTAKADDRDLPASSEEIMAGIFRDMLERQLVPVRAKTEEVVPRLMRAWQADASGAAGPTRAAVANAFTRYAHTEANLDPWQEDEIQRAAGSLLVRTKNGNGWAKSFGFLAPEDVE